MSTGLLSTPFELTGRKIWVAGHRGMVGSAIVRRLASEDCQVLTAGRDQVDLTRQAEVEAWMAQHRPDVVVLAAAKVGGIHANSTFPADFIRDNLAIQDSVITTSARLGVTKLLFLGSSCIYPRAAAQPINEDSLLTGPLEPTNEWYAIAKIAGIKLCQAYRRQDGCDFISVMPTNQYGPNDNYHPEHSHVPAALIRRIHEAKQANAESVAVWGSGRPMREFMFVDDMADACIHVLKAYSGEGILNVGTGSDVSIAEFAGLIKEVIGFKGALVFDPSRPDGMPRKLLDVSRLAAIGWRAPTPLAEGLAKTYQAFLQELGHLRGA